MMRKRQRRLTGRLRPITDLQTAIHRYIAEHNDDPNPFFWTKTAHDILAKTSVYLYLPNEWVHLVFRP
jgi:hypothetical protein